MEPETILIDEFAIVDSEEFVNCFARDKDNHSILLFEKFSRDRATIGLASQKGLYFLRRFMKTKQA